MRLLACALLVISTTYATKVSEPGASNTYARKECYCVLWGYRPRDPLQPLQRNPLLRQTRGIKEAEDTCKSGKSFKYYCNTCFCGNDGLANNAVCTFMDCDPEVWNKDGTLKHPNKIANNPLLRETREIKKIEKFCIQWICVRRGPLQPLLSNPLLRQTRGIKKAEDTCEPGKSFMYYCNACFCGNDGLANNAVCTLMDCDPEVWNKDGTLKHLNEIANNPVLRETRAVKENEDTCEPGKHFRYYCNSCFCGDDGKVEHSVCTRRSCNPEVWNKDGSLKHTNVIANNPLLRRTREIEENKDTCEPGKGFKYYCNLCSCANDGKVAHSACTKMYCDPELWNKDGSLKHTNEIANNPLLRKTREIEENEDTCEPGNRFRYYCNLCSCGNDGKVAHSVCTKMYCDPELWNKDGSPRHFTMSL